VPGIVRHTDQVAGLAFHFVNLVVDVQREQARAGDEKAHFVLAMGMFVEEFLPDFRKHYAYLSDRREHVTIVYESEVSNPNFADEFRHFRRRDTVLQRTTMGIHKDDYAFLIGEREAGPEGPAPVPLKKFGSQGQQKTFVIGLKLAQFDQLQAAKGIKPILLLDDIFDKLDDHRVQRLMQLVSCHTFGQIFITDTHPERLKQIFEAIQVELTTFEVTNGEVVAE